MLRNSLAFVLLACSAVPARAGLMATYTPLANGTAVDLTAAGTLDWVKWGNSTTSGLGFASVEKVGGTIINPGLTPLGTAPPGFSVVLASFSGGGNLRFSWTDGTAGMAGGGPTVDTAVSETLSPAAFSYPIGIGATFTANASAVTRVMDVYVFGFDSDTLLTATLSGGETTSTVVSPTFRPPNDPNNDYSLGRYRITFDGVGETLTVSMITRDPRTSGAQSAFANAGIFAASIADASPAAVPEPASVSLAAAGVVLLAGAARYRRARSRG